MIGNIVDIDNVYLSVRLSFDVTKTKNLLNNFVIIKDETIQFIGEIEKIKDGIAKVRLVGEVVAGKVLYGTIRRPSFKSEVYFVAKDYIPFILGSSFEATSLKLGHAAVYESEVSANIDSLFGSHFAIFGSTGSGKSCGLARIVQNLFTLNAPKRARIIIFDAYGEYKSAFQHLPGNVFKTYTTDLRSNDAILKVPLWLLTKDDIALLLNATTSSQLLIIDKALRFVNVFARTTKEAREYKNSVIASALLDILMSGRSPVRIRDHVLAILQKHNTEDLNVETKIVQPGYIRTIKMCMNIDRDGKMSAIEAVENKLQEFIIDNIELSLPDGSYKYTLEDLLDSLEFALIDEGVWKSEDTYDSINFLKIRLQNLIKNDSSRYFDLDYISREDFIKSIFSMDDGRNAQIVNYNINYIDDRFAKTITKIYSRLIFDYSKDLEVRASEPINIILEEAHRYVQNDSDVDVIGYNIFERICKEGRKYGVLMGFISQRPLELSETCISQCLNFLIFKMTHVRDLEFIKGSVPNITEDMLEKIKALYPGSALAFGKSFSLPIAIDFEMPNPSPASENAEIYKIWFS